MRENFRASHAEDPARAVRPGDWHAADRVSVRVLGEGGGVRGILSYRTLPGRCTILETPFTARSGKHIIAEVWWGVPITMAKRLVCFLMLHRLKKLCENIMQQHSVFFQIF